MSRPRRQLVILAALAVLAAGCTGGGGTTIASPTSPAPTSPPAATSPAAPTTAPAPGQSSNSPSGNHSAPTAKPSGATNAQMIAAATESYTKHAVPARAQYYRFARSLDATKAAQASHQLADWYVNPARAFIVGQVANWDPNYRENIDVTSNIRVLRGRVNSDGTVTLTTVETWTAGTEGTQEVPDRNGKATVAEDHVEHFITLQLFTGWAVAGMP